jgi:hypothetical protein
VLLLCGDQVERYPVHLSQQPQKEKDIECDPFAPAPVHGGGGGGDDPFCELEGGGRSSPYAAGGEAGRGGGGGGGGGADRKRTLMTKVKAPKLKASFNKQIQMWKAKREELEPEEEEEVGTDDVGTIGYICIYVERERESEKRDKGDDVGTVG